MVDEVLDLLQQARGTRAAAAEMRRLREAVGMVDARLAEMKRMAAAERERFWGCSLDLVREGRVEIVEYDDFSEVKQGDLVIITRGEFQGHAATVSELRPSRRSSGSDWVVLSRVWPTTWRGPAGSYWPRECIWGAFARLAPTVPEFSSPAEADWWMHDARELAVGQRVAFTFRTSSLDAPYLHCSVECSGVLVGIEEFDQLHWIRYRPVARGRFQVMAYAEDMEPTLMWAEEIVRL